MHLSETQHATLKSWPRRDLLKPKPLSQDLRPSAVFAREFEYDSPRSPELSEDAPPLLRSITDQPKDPKVNALPCTLRKDLKNPLTNGKMRITMFGESQGVISVIRETNAELKAKVVKIEEEIKKWRRLRLLTLQKEKQIEQLQLSIKLAEQEKAELQRSILSPRSTSIRPDPMPISTQHWEDVKEDMALLRLRLATFLASKSM